jgi:drug/metabolite transporter (DMT)-like permease
VRVVSFVALTVQASAATEPARAPTRAPVLAVVAALVTVTAWASAFIGIRDVGEEISAGALALGRLLVASAALALIVAIRREPLPARRDLPAIALCGVLWFGLYNVALNEAERHVDAGTAAMLVNVGPILIALLAGVLLHEGFPRSLLAGSAVAFAGAIVIGFATSDGGLAASGGAALCVVAALSYAGGVVSQKPVLARVSALQVTFLASTVATLACVPFAPTLIDEVADASGSAIRWTVYLGLVPTALAFTTWAYALSHTTAGRMGATTYLVPPLAILMAWLILDETPPALAIAGGTLCLIGVVLARR